jgi:hypothetical protein
MKKGKIPHHLRWKSQIQILPILPNERREEGCGIFFLCHRLVLPEGQNRPEEKERGMGRFFSPDNIYTFIQLPKLI